MQHKKKLINIHNKIDTEIALLTKKLNELTLEDCVDEDDMWAIFNDYLANITGALTVNDRYFDSVEDLNKETLDLMYEDFKNDLHVEDTDRYQSLLDKIDELKDVKFEMEQALMLEAA